MGNSVDVSSVDQSVVVFIRKFSMITKSVVEVSYKYNTDIALICGKVIYSYPITYLQRCLVLRLLGGGGGGGGGLN